MILLNVILSIVIKPGPSVDFLVIMYLIDGFFTIIIIVMWNFYSRLIIKVETEGPFYRLTSMTFKKTLLDPDMVLRITRSERFRTIVLRDNRRFHFERRLTFTGFLSMRYYDPWVVFLTPERFKNVEF